MTAARRRLDGDLLALLALALLVALRFAPDWLRGLAPFWGDLTYIHQGWRVFDSELLAAGRLPLWNPYLYFGMPQAASMQDGLFYPGSTPCLLWGFSSGLAFYEALHYWLAGALGFLWLRACGLRRAAAFGGAALFALGGLLLSREPFINQLAVLALTPALVLFFRRPSLLALALAVAFFAGYPTFLIGGALAAWVVAAAAAPRRRGQWPRTALGWAFACAASAALAGCLLLPAAQLTARSMRASGLPLAEVLDFGFSPRDLARWLSPLLASRFSPGVDWWKCCYLGFVASGCAVAGLFALPRARALILGAWVAAVFLLTLGGCFPPSCWLWAHCVLLRFVRYPGNMAYLALLPLSLLAAAGLDRMRAPLRGLLAAAICAELSLLAWRAMPRAARAELSNPGPLARRLQGELDGGRYLLSPLALEAVSGSSVPDWRQRLYGLTNAPSKLRAASNFGEPLVPQANYALMDRLLSAPSAAAAAALLPWLDVRVLLSPKPVHGPGLAPAGRTLWFVSRVRGASDAWLLPFAAGTALGPGSLALPASARPIPVERGREDAFSARGDKSGWLFVAEPLYPGWRVWLETPRGPGLAFPMPAFGPFQKLAVPVGRWTLHWRYRPRSFSWGLALTLCAALALGFPWLGRLRAANFHDA